ncbi:hypothetical protein BaRGS_00033209 [Batillaria attramentaria]|uniref:Secreted protein n=1 Tax=Batillaria attramentaria TaxID=370345 RepID=A0ABD0JKM2_9CAEN
MLVPATVCLVSFTMLVPGRFSSVVRRQSVFGPKHIRFGCLTQPRRLVKLYTWAFRCRTGLRSQCKAVHVL